MNWIILVIAGLLEIGWAVGLKHTEGFTRLWPSLGTITCMALSLGLLGFAMKSLPMSTAYAVWVGIGVAGTSVLGVAMMGEPITPIRAASIVLILVGVAGLKWA